MMESLIAIIEILQLKRLKIFNQDQDRVRLRIQFNIVESER